jgi:hypothetical protein
MGPMQGRNHVTLKRIAMCLLVVLVLFGFGCTSIEKAEPTAVDTISPRKDGEGSYGEDLKSKLNYILRGAFNTLHRCIANLLILEVL